MAGLYLLNYNLTQGNIIWLVVGQMGTSGNNAGGGGGTFVIAANNVLLFAAWEAAVLSKLVGWSKWL
jgi:hypothetical protein